jgi:hypothetical protein
MSPAAHLIAVPKRARHSHRPTKRASRAKSFGDLAVHARRLPCLVSGCERGPIDAAHVRSRGAGGQAWLIREGAEVGNIVPLCRCHHTGGGGVLRPQHNVGVKAFEREHQLVVQLPGQAAQQVDTMAHAAAIIGWWFKAGAPEGAGPC